MNFEPTVFIAALVIGAFIVLSVIFRYLKGQQIALPDLLFALLGVLLISLSLWQNIKFSLEGGNFEVNRLEKKVADNRDAILDNNIVLNSKVADLNRRIEQLASDVNTLRRNNPDAQISQEELNRRKQEEAAVRENSQYSVFVFYRSSRRQDANIIVQALSEAGYSSSKIMTDLSEATNPQPEGITALIYTENGKKKVQAVDKILRDLGLGDSIKTEPESRRELGRGDINLLLF